MITDRFPFPVVREPEIRRQFVRAGDVEPRHAPSGQIAEQPFFTQLLNLDEDR